ncbi:tetratricopeptide repeat protein [Neisseria sp. CCUG12390]|uniref:tetratricopeptide repeat protein n=1 Tax=Neisseria sp. CCUG12390 TaxID=3392035 RepID=UPI003A102446
MTDAETLYQQACKLLDENPNSRQALVWLCQAAEQGHAEAAFEVGMIMLEAEQPDYQAVIAWLEIAAAHKHRYAAYNLLRIRESIMGIAFDRHLPQYVRLAESGLLPAQLKLLEYYADRHDAEAVYWAQQVAGQGHPFGQYFLAMHHHFSDGPDLQRAFELYRQAAEQGLHVAHWQRGKMYRHGIGTPADNTLAAHHLRFAAENGFIAAQTLLADILAEQNHSDALKWYQTAADNGDRQARTALARHYLTGRLTGRDPLQAAKHAKIAAQQHYPEAMQLMGDIYRYGLGIKADAQTAEYYYREAAEQGSLSAYQKLLSDAALHHPEQYGRIKTAALYYQQAEQACRQALVYHQGRGNRAVDYVRARKLYLEAAASGHTEAAFGLGLMYFYGQGVKTDYRQAAYWFEQAAEQGHAEAQYRLARLYYYGQGVAVSLHAACTWLQAAIENGHENPQAFLYLLDKWRQEAGLAPVK